MDMPLGEGPTPPPAPDGAAGPLALASSPAVLRVLMDSYAGVDDPDFFYGITALGSGTEAVSVEDLTLRRLQRHQHEGQWHRLLGVYDTQFRNLAAAGLRPVPMPVPVRMYVCMLGPPCPAAGQVCRQWQGDGRHEGRWLHVGCKTDILLLPVKPNLPILPPPPRVTYSPSVVSFWGLGQSPVYSSPHDAALILC